MKEQIVDRLRIYSIAIGTAVALMIAPLGMAEDVEVERAALVSLVHELEQLEFLLQQAESAAVSTQRVHFQYAWVRADLAKIKSGVREYLDTVPITPRAVPPLAGDYIR